MKKRWRWAMLLVAVAVFLLWLVQPDGARSHAQIARTLREPSASASRSACRTRVEPEPIQRSAPVKRASRSERDPILTALPPNAATTIVLEAETLFSLPVGQMLRRCLAGSPAFGVPMENVEKLERIAFAELSDGRRMGLIYGELNDQAEAASAGSGRPSKVWDQKLWMYGDRSQDLNDAVDRLEGRGSEAESVPENERYGEIHGRLAGDFLGMLLPPELAQEVKSSGARFNFHVDASEGLLLSIDASGDAAALEKLGRGLSRAFDAMSAKTGQNATLSQIVQNASVRNSAQGLSLEAFLSIDVLRELLGSCAAEPAR